MAFKKKYCQKNNELIPVILYNVKKSVMFHGRGSMNTDSSVGTIADRNAVLFEGTNDAALLLRVMEDGQFLYQAVNHHYLTVVGLKLEEMIGKTPVEVHGQEAGHYIVSRLQCCLEAREPIQYEETIVISGVVRNALVKLSPIFCNGRIDQIFSSTRDMTEQKLFERNLREQKKNLEVLFTSSSDGIALFDRDHRILDINQRFTDIFGFELDEIRGMNLDDVITNSKLRKSAGELTEQLMAGTAVSLEAVRYHRNGTPIQVFVRGLAIEVDGVITGGYGIYTDITNEKNAQEALRVSEERWQFALEGSGNGVWDWDMKSDKVYFSNQYLQILGYRPDEISSAYETFLSLVHPDDLPALIQAHEQHVNQVIDLMELEFRMKCRDESYKWILSKGKIMSRNRLGRPQRMVGTITDITDRKAAEEKILFLSYHDKLTGLYNRAFFEEEMNRFDYQRNWPLSIIIGDVDGLKIANDTYGHHVGDSLLIRIAEILKNACRHDDVIARWGEMNLPSCCPVPQRKMRRRLGNASQACAVTREICP
jgi:PAS domain S-box-containing protein